MDVIKNLITSNNPVIITIVSFPINLGYKLWLFKFHRYVSRKSYLTLKSFV